MRLGRKRRLDGVNLMELAPLRSAEWEEAAGRVTIVRPRPRARGARRAVEWLSYVMSVRRVRLDEMGSFAWKLLDSRRSVAEVAAELRHEFGEASEPAEERLGLLIRQLHSQEFVVYPGWDPPEDGTI